MARECAVMEGREGADGWVRGVSERVRESGLGLVCPWVRLGGLDPGLGWPS